MKNIKFNKYSFSSGNLGEYNLKSNSLVDILENNEAEMKYTEVHEYTHYILAKETSYGSFIYIFNNIKHFDGSFDWFFDILFKRSQTTQESAATYIQVMSIYYMEGDSKFRSILAKMRVENYTYYKYYDTFSFLNSLIKNREDIIRVISFVIELCKALMDIDLTRIDVESIIDRKYFKKILNDQSFVNDFSPDKRLKIVTKELIENINSDSNFCLEAYNPKNITFHNVSMNEEYLDTIKKYFVTLFHNSKSINSIEEKLSKYYLTDKLPGLLSVYPTIINAVELLPKLEVTKADHKDRLELFDNSEKIGILSFFFHELVVDKFLPVVYLGLKPFEKKTTYFTYKEIKSLLNTNQKPVVLIGNKELCIIKLREIKELNKNSTFILLETALINNIMYINKYLSNGHFRVFNYPKFSVLVIKKDYANFIQLISSNALCELLDEIDNGFINLKRVEVDQNNFDSFIIRNKSEKFNLDLVINAIFIQLVKTGP